MYALKTQVGYVWAPDICAPGLSGARNLRRTIAGFFRFVFLELRCFGLQLASLALGLRTLVETGSHSTAYKKLPASLIFLHNSKRRPNIRHPSGKVPSCLAPNRRRPNGGAQMGLLLKTHQVFCVFDTHTRKLQSIPPILRRQASEQPRYHRKTLWWGYDYKIYLPQGFNPIKGLIHN